MRTSTSTSGRIGAAQFSPPPSKTRHAARNRRKGTEVFAAARAVCHICRYCLISESRKRSALPFSRFEQLVHRFHDWKQSSRRDLEIGIFVGPSFDYDLDTLQGVARLRARRGSRFETLNLGGLRIRRGDELIAWLEERRGRRHYGFPRLVCRLRRNARQMEWARRRLRLPDFDLAAGRRARNGSP
jgi:hypothetical protein